MNKTDCKIIFRLFILLMRGIFIIVRILAKPGDDVVEDLRFDYMLFQDDFKEWANREDK